MIENRREAMKAKHALYLGLIIIGAAFLVVGSTVLGLIFEGVGAVLLLISALLEGRMGIGRNAPNQYFLRRGDPCGLSPLSHKHKKHLP